MEDMGNANLDQIVENYKKEMQDEANYVNFDFNKEAKTYNGLYLVKNKIFNWLKKAPDNKSKLYIKNSALSNYLINFGEYTIQTLKTDTDKYVKIKITKVMPNTYTTILRAAKEDVRSHQNIIKLVKESKKLPDSLKSILIMHIENGLTILDEVYMVEMMFHTPVYIL